MSNIPNLTVAERRLMMLDGSTVLFRADNAAWYTLERHTGKQLMQFLQEVLDKLSSGDAASIPLGDIYDLAFALSATHRRREGQSPAYGQDSPEFLDLISVIPPVFPDVRTFLDPLMSLLTESFRSGKGSDDEAPAEAVTASGNGSRPRRRPRA